MTKYTNLSSLITFSPPRTVSDREREWIYDSHLLCTSLTVLSIEFEDSLRSSLEKGKFDEITDKITPRDLTKCNTNALLMAMEVSLTPVPVVNALILPNMLFLVVFV